MGYGATPTLDASYQAAGLQAAGPQTAGPQTAGLQAGGLQAPVPSTQDGSENYLYGKQFLSIMHVFCH